MGDVGPSCIHIWTMDVGGRVGSHGSSAILSIRRSQTRVVIFSSYRRNIIMFCWFGQSNVTTPSEHITDWVLQESWNTGRGCLRMRTILTFLLQSWAVQVGVMWFISKHEQDFDKIVFWSWEDMSSDLIASDWACMGWSQSPSFCAVHYFDSHILEVSKWWRCH